MTTPLELKTLRYDAADGVATVTLDRPDRLNAWTGRMHTELRHVFMRAESDPDVRVVIVTGAGRGFCSGADFRALGTHIERGGYDPGTPPDLDNPGYGVRQEFDADFAWMLGLRVTTIAAINGPAAGVGFVLACYCDLRFAAAGAKLTTSHGTLGLPAEYGLSWLLPRLIGVTRAADILLSSRVLLAEEAADIGLVNRTVPANRVLDEARSYAADLIERVAPASLATTKRQLWLDQLHDDVGASVRNADVLLREMMTEPDYAEAVRAFNEKRPPNWTTR